MPTVIKNKLLKKEIKYSSCPLRTHQLVETTVIGIYLNLSLTWQTE